MRTCLALIVILLLAACGPRTVRVMRADGDLKPTWSDADRAKPIAVRPCARTSTTVRDRAMRQLYHMNVTQATLFPDLDGLARSMAYELEFHWDYDPHAPREPQTSRISKLT